MLRFRRLLLATATLAAAAFAASPATAYVRPVGYPELLTSDHFQVHYTGDDASTSRIVSQKAGDLAAQAELAYSAITGWGYPAPLDDGDGKIDIWVIDQGVGILASASPDNESANSTSGWIEVAPAYVADVHVAAHEIFHLIQFRTWLPTDLWLLESSAEWVGFRVDNYDTANGLQLAQPDMSVDCLSTACGDDPYEQWGYSRWTFWEYVGQRFGTTIVQDVLGRLAADGDPNAKAVDALETVLAGKGASLGDVLQDYAVANLAGTYTVIALANLAPVAHSSTFAGVKTGALPAQRVPVNHLAARYLEFKRGDGASDGRCYAATLSLTVALPSGLNARPYFYFSADGSAAVPLTVSGSTASISVPWDTCTWAADSPYTHTGFLSLPNPSKTADAQVFTVSGTLTVDKTTPASATAPPETTVRGTVVDAPANEVPPTIVLYGPAVLTVSAKARALHVVVFSSGGGSLEATLGSVGLGTTELRAGNNDLRLKLPAAARRVLAASRSTVLSLTSLSPSGAKGATLTRKVRLASRRR